ncbi:GDSL-type esterase/lipase family protein [Rufibacter roseus]|uniref:GDSL-type esterase/lipase family protein n=1 Tax=Rufibacter roseus TaxID=1567108 RepID=A0ABW2DN69_9BACT
MRNNYLFILFLLFSVGLFSTNGFAQESKEIINIDFGPDNQKSASPWNNITNAKTGSVSDLISDYGTNTGISIAITDPFNSWNLNGVTADDTLGIPYSASRESFYGNTVYFNNATIPFSSLTLSNLDVTKAYSFAFFAARADVNDNRETLYTVEGLTSGSATLNATRNVSKMARVSNIKPKEDGTIIIVVEPGPNNNNSSGFFYISALRISYMAERGPKSLSLISPIGTQEFKAGKDATIAWDRSGVATVNLDYSVDNGANWLPIASNIPASNRLYKWTVPAVSTENALVRVVDSADPAVFDVSDQPFTIFQGTNGKSFTIVVLGSSTAAGAGPTRRDSAWVWKYRNYLDHKRSNFTVTNLAVGGYNTASILPENNPENNITKALSLNPDAIIINLPSNDAAGGRSVDAQMANYEVIASRAAQANVPLWVTTPQPRNFTQDKVQIQLGMIDATYARFGEDFTVDFWTGFNTANNTMKPEYDSGDGVHMNDAAHRIMLERIIGENISGYLEDGPLGVKQEIWGKVNVFPNPASGRVHISAGEGYVVEKVQLVNLSGMKVLEQQKVSVLEVGALPKGLYILHVYTNKGLLSSKLVVQ